MSLSISKLIDVSRERLPIPVALLTSLLLLISSFFRGWVPLSGQWPDRKKRPAAYQ